LVAGVMASALVANVAMCAYGAIMLPRMDRSAIWHRIDVRELPPLPPAPSGRQYLWNAHACNRLAACRVSSHCMDWDRRGFLCGTGMLRPEPVRSVAAWCDLNDLTPGVAFRMPTKERAVGLALFGIGWPAPCLTGTVETYESRSGTMRIGCVHGLTWRPGESTKWESKQFILPFRPVWSAIIGNMLTWMALIALAPLAWSTLHSVAPWLSRTKRRLARGECGRCGYQLMGLERCPECGVAPARS
jgi:hypothetical protein